MFISLPARLQGCASLLALSFATASLNSSLPGPGGILTLGLGLSCYGRGTGVISVEIVGTKEASSLGISLF